MEHNRIIYEKPYDSEVEYLESTGTQYIDTAVYGSNNSKVELDLQLLELGASKAVFGCYNPNRALYMYQAGGDSNGKWQFGFGYNANIGKTDTNRHLVVCENFDLTMDGSLIFSHVPKTFTTPYTMLLFNMHNNSGGIYSATGIRIFSCKLYNNSILVRDFIPVRKGSIGYLYDKVSKKLFANQGTGNFILGPDVANPIPNIRRVFRFGNKRFVMPMPYDSKVEYLESTGTQYIDTGFVPTINSKMDIELACTNENTSSINWMGCTLKSNKGWFTVGAYGNNNLEAVFAVTEKKGAKFTFDNSFHKYYISNGLQKIDNIESNNTISNFGGTMLNVYLFTGNRNFTTSTTGKQKIKYCKIYEGEKLFRDFIPVRIGNVGYMYDRISCRLFGNSGTGQFILGQDIND